MATGIAETKVGSSVDPALAGREVDSEEAAEIKAAAEKAGSVEMVSVALIEKSEVALRDVDRSGEPYQLLVNSVKKVGVLQSILVRKIDVGGITKYGLIDGLQRFTAAKDAGLTQIPARIVEMDDAELLEAQIITNMTRVQTKPAELSKHLLRMLARNPLMTKAELAGRVCQSHTWVEQRLSLNKLAPKIQELVDEGRIHLTNAYALSKIPEEEQPKHVDAAMSEKPNTFVPRMKARQKEIRDAKNAGRDASDVTWAPTRHLQKISDVKREFEILMGEAKGDSAVLAALATAGIKTDDNAKKIAQTIIAWALHFDKDSQIEQKRIADVRDKKRKETHTRLKKEREDKRAEQAVIDSADITKL